MAKCKKCKCDFEPRYFLQPFCMETSECIAAHTEYAKLKMEKGWRKRKAVIKDSLKTHSDWSKELQKVFNEYIRLRDIDLPCVSCGTNSGQFHAGHYRTTKACPELRYNEFNVWKQCATCNNFLSGNILNYRKELINRIGVEKVEWIEGDHEPLKLTIPELIKLKSKFNRLVNKMKKL